MIKKILLGGLAGGAILFVWGVIAWMILPLHDASMRTLPNAAVVTKVLRENVKEAGVYYFPELVDTRGMTTEQANAAMADWKTRHREGPVGFLVLHPNGAEPMNVRHFAGSFVIQFTSALIVAWLLSKAMGGFRTYLGRLLFVVALGLFAGVAVDLPYWNWFNFPADYTVAALIDHVVGWGLVGLAIAAIVKPTGKKVGV